MEGETLFAVYDGKGMGRGFIGLPDRRAIIRDNSMVGGKVALTSPPYMKIQNFSYLADKSCSGSSQPRQPLQFELMAQRMSGVPAEIGLVMGTA